MIDRKEFLKISALGGLLPLKSVFSEEKPKRREKDKPVVISTWGHGIPANAKAWKTLHEGGSPLDAVEAGVRVTEADPDVMSVGYGAYPDRDGHITLDACIMDHQNRCGSVAFLENILHPISVARLVKEETPHVMLVGEGAQQFAFDQGFEKSELLTPKARKAWQEWLDKTGYTPNESNLYDPDNEKHKPDIGAINHDTIGMIALDEQGQLSGACTTSGTAFKMHGRVGDSPIIGAGLFVDNEVGGAAATGVGEEVIRIAGSHAVVEYMRQGDHPETACRKAVERIIRNNNGDVKDIQVGFVALNKQGETGAYCIKDGFKYALYQSGQNQLIDAKHVK